MMLSYHRGYGESLPPAVAAPRKRRRRKAAEPAPPAHESLTGDDYAALSDEQVLDAYVSTIPGGEATERDAQVAELRAVSAFAHTFADQPTEGGSEGE